MMQITKRVVSFKFGVLAIIIGLMLAALTVANANGFHQGFLHAFENLDVRAEVPPSVDAVSANQSLTGRYLWRFALDNRTDASAGAASVTINSGHSAALLGVPSLPVTDETDSDLLPNESILVRIENGNVPATFTQLVTVRVIPRDSGYLKPDPAFNPHIGVNIKAEPGAVVVANPDGSDGEDLGGGGQADPGGAHWLIHGVLLDKTYVFAAEIQVNNPTGSPQCHKPGVEVGMTSHSEAAPDAGTRFQGGENSIQVAEPTLDGPTANAGLATYSATQDLGDGLTHVWLSRLQDGFTVDYRNLPSGICTVDVGIDIKPFSDPNSINLGNNGTIPVAIFSTAGFDATRVDPATVTLADAAVKVRGKGKTMANAEDVNSDGLLDLVVHVETAGLALTAGETTATLEGVTIDGFPIVGTDSVRVITE